MESQIVHKVTTLLGGSFNPLHIGHLRLAASVYDALIDSGIPATECRIEMLPTAHPPHKSEKGLLPFELRCRMIESIAVKWPWLSCNRLESQKQGPSYTWNTLLAMGEQPKPFFVLGSADYELLPTWYRGLDLPELCELVVVPRNGFDAGSFPTVTARMWPGAEPCRPFFAGGLAMRLANRHICHFLTVPRLEISASQIRELWLDGRNTDYLMPETVFDILKKNAEIVSSHWQEAM